MKLSQRADYGLAALLYLSQKSENRRSSLGEISQATEIPEEDIKQILKA